MREKDTGEKRRRVRRINNPERNTGTREPERKSNKSSPVPFFCAEPVIGYGTDPGRRRINQDALLVMTAETDCFRENTVIFAAVCDGMGGHTKGEEASRTAVTEMERWFRSIFPGCLADPAGAVGKAAESLRELFLEIHKKLRAAASESGENGMGTTACALLLLGPSYIAAHTGDSRIYAFSEKTPLVTRDHSWVMEEFAAGRLGEEEMKTDPRRNVLMKCLGIGNGPDPDIRIGLRKKGAEYLLCSDGFWRERGPAVMLEGRDRGILSRGEAETLIRRGFEENIAAWETDNMSAVLLRDEWGENGGSSWR